MKTYRFALMLPLGVLAALAFQGPAQAAIIPPTCVANPLAATADGQAQSFNQTNPCSVSVDGTGPLGSRVFGSTEGIVAGTVRLFEFGSGSADINMAFTQSFGSTVRLPTIFERAIGDIVEIGGITYNLTDEAIIVFGTAHESTGGSPDDARVDFSVTVDTSGNAVTSDTTEVGPCGSGTTVCGSVNQRWTVATPFVSPVPVLDFTIAMTETGLLDTENPNNGTLNASDTFAITEMELLDANGNVIPGAIFTADDGTVFPSPGSPSVPEPGSLALFVSALALGSTVLRVVDEALAKGKLIRSAEVGFLAASPFCGLLESKVSALAAECLPWRRWQVGTVRSG